MENGEVIKKKIPNKETNKKPSYTHNSMVITSKKGGGGELGEKSK